MSLRVLAVLFLSIGFAGCGKKDKEVKDKVTYVAEDDPKMNAAMQKARSSVNSFIAALKTPMGGQTSFGVKFGFTDGKNVEHMWVSPVSYDGKVFKGKLSNDPEKVKNVRNGQEVTIEPAQVSDWMYVDKGKLVGGYTIRVLRETLSGKERADFDKSVPFVIE